METFLYDYYGPDYLNWSTVCPSSTPIKREKRGLHRLSRKFDDMDDTDNEYFKFYDEIFSIEQDIIVTSTKQFPFTHILGWSSSRFDLFNICKRKYYYNYYGKHDPEIPFEKIKFLKGLTSIPLEIGNIVHDVIKTLLERFKSSSDPIDIDRLFDYAKRKTTNYCKKNFQEIHYKKKNNIYSYDIYQSVKICLTNFIESERFSLIQKQAENQKTHWIIEPSGYGETRINGLKAYCKVDFLFFNGDDIVIMDWKTGKRDDSKQRDQMIGYATWASFHYDHDPEKIFPIVAFLKDGYSEMALELNEFDIQEFAVRVRDETELMYDYCSDIEKNIPKSKNHFPKTANEALCSFCNFYELCNEIDQLR